MGFVRPPETIAYHIDEKLGRTAVEAARHKFSPEFINRLHKLVVFRPLEQTALLFSGSTKKHGNSCWMKVRISATGLDT
ncbi:MAG TPA: hypothetical protein VKH63_16790 [Candidatus Acidoferrum sp.]|nr:hypothetical protein [Candidatus Acidoferrum sp.]